MIYRDLDIDQEQLKRPMRCEMIALKSL